MKKIWIVLMNLSLCFTTVFGACGMAYADTSTGTNAGKAAAVPAVAQEITICPEEPDVLTIVPAQTQNGAKTQTGQKAGSVKKVSAKKTTDKAASKKKNPTARQVLKSIKKSLGKSYTSDQAETKETLASYWDLDMEKVVSWAAETNSNSSLQSDCAIVLKVKKGYAKKAAAKLQKGYEQILSYNRMYNMDLQRVLQARLYRDGNYVALIIEGKKADYNDSAEAQAKFAAKEGKKIDKAWKKIFGSAKNKIKVPKEDKKQNNFFGEELETTGTAAANGAGMEA